MFKDYKYSIILFLLLSLISLSYFLTQNISFEIFFKLNWQYLFLMPLAMFFSSLAFLFPLYIVADKRLDRKSIFKNAMKIIDWTYLNIISRKDNFFSEMKYNKRSVFEIISGGDIIAIMIFSLLIFFTDSFLFNFFLPVIILEFLIFVFLFYKNKGFREALKNPLLVLSCLFRYFVELVVPAVAFLIFGFEISFISLILFTTTTSMLYYIPRFKLAGGLLTLYCMLMFFVVGEGLFLGYLFAVFIRLSSVIFYILPIWAFGKLRGV